MTISIDDKAHNDNAIDNTPVDSEMHNTRFTQYATGKNLRIFIVCIAAITVVILTCISPSLYRTEQAQPTQPLAYSATQSPSADSTIVSRGAQRSTLPVANNISYVNVRINGKQRVVVGTKFTNVKSVLEAADITLNPNDTVNPSLNTRVTESTVIEINRANTYVNVQDEPIDFNTIRKLTKSLPKGVEKVQTEGKKGVMETTRLITGTNDKISSSHIFTSVVKNAPVDKVILVGTAEHQRITPAANMGVTVPVGVMQQWAHDYLLSQGKTEADFTATVYIITRESGWRVNAMNPSGAYGLPQALPGRKMASAGPDWATNYQTQLKWFWNYCNSRYGSIQGAYQFWITHHYY